MVSLNAEKLERSWLACDSGELLSEFIKRSLGLHDDDQFDIVGMAVEGDRLEIRARVRLADPVRVGTGGDFWASHDVRVARDGTVLVG